jgi:hypothetical protein
MTITVDDAKRGAMWRLCQRLLGSKWYVSGGFSISRSLDFRLMRVANMSPLPRKSSGKRGGLQRAGAVWRLE